jgi:hypothetical protein
MLRRRERAVSNHEATAWASSFEMLAMQASQDEGIESLTTQQG